MHMRRTQGSESAQILRRGTISIVSTSTTRRGRTAGDVPRFCGPHHVTHHSISHNPAGSSQIYQVGRELTSPSDVKEENLKSVIPLASVALTQVPRCRPRTCVEADWRAHQHATQAIVCFIQGPPSGQQRRIGLMFCSSSSSQLKDSLPAQASFRFVNPGRRAASAIGPRRRSSHTGESSVGAEASKHGRAPSHRATTLRPRVWSILTRWWAWRDAHLLSPDWKLSEAIPA